MKIQLLVLTFMVGTALAQTPAPGLEKNQIAADTDDPAAQDKLAEKCMMRADTAQAEIWYRKAAEQGFAHAQGRLGNLLLMRSRLSVGAPPAARSALGGEAAKWITLAANQGDPRGQADFADICLEGKWVKQDLVEAYKWGELASRGPVMDTAAVGGRATRDAAILKMSAEQFVEARKRVAAFVPDQTQKSKKPEPSWVNQIKLNHLSGIDEHRSAVINHQTFQKGETWTIKAGEKSVRVQCVEVRKSSVLVTIEGFDGLRELRLP
jgi:hypothetical protein